MEIPVDPVTMAQVARGGMGAFAGLGLSCLVNR